jgi:membrane protease YdiL (CAAX protease family)
MPGDSAGKPWLVLGTSAACLLAIQFGVMHAEIHWTLSQSMSSLLASLPIFRLTPPGDVARLAEVLTWAAGTIGLYLLIPVLVVRALLGERLGAFGFCLGNSRRYARISGAVLLLAFAVVGAASFLEDFVDFYPYFVPTNSLSLFLFWELVYGIQLLAVEFFYRGFLLHGLKARFGDGALWIMLAPYVMIHLAKPWPEVVGAVVAGLGLGLLSLRSGSIAIPALLHIMVAWWMDLLALWHRGGFG